MAITDLPVVRAFKEKLRFHGERQKVLAENIANATTPGYQGRDIAAPDFFRVAVEGSRPAPVAPAVTNVAHLPGHVGNRHHLRDRKVDGYEVTPDGNAVVLEEQMMKVAENQMEYQVATSLYQRSLGLLRTAVGRR
jgi:flagellar basal-body rod protein FlgB